MYFKRIELQGFKSFAEPVTIEFQEGITCIVGPNGSGKSNISDALRWVLGEQSPKALRGGKMEEVIFAGTASRKPKGMAEVTLVIDNTAGILPVDFSEVALRRRMYRSGESEYSINSVQCRLRDIRELIMDTGIGVDGYSIISQGKISEIVSSKPENRRELFEEAAGVTRYKARKAESERKLESAEANLERVDDIVEEIESRIGKLKTDSEKAAEHLVLRDRYKTLEINITLKNIENIQLKNEYLADELAEANARIEDIREEKGGQDAEAKAARARIEAIDVESEGLRERLMANMNATNEIKSRASLNDEKKLTLERDKKRLNDELDALAAKLANEESELAGMEENAAGAGSKLAEIRARHEAAAAEAAIQTKKLSEYASAIDGGKSELFEIHRVLAAKDSELTGLLNLDESLEKRHLQIQEEIKSAETEMNFARAESEAARGMLDAAAAEKMRLEEERAEAESLMAELTTREDGLLADEQKARLLNEQLSARKKTIEEMESNYEGYSQGVKEVMKSGIKGLRGVAAELARAPKGLELAVETALGAAMQYIVCDDDESAKAAIAFLKERKAGRLTFLPLKNMKVRASRRDKALLSAEGSLGYAVDVIDFDPEYQNIFEYLLGRVLLADNLDNAAKIAKRAEGIRLVTKGGDVINAAGAMTGGAYRNKSANLLERRAEIAELAQQLEGIAKEREGISADLAELGKAKAANVDVLLRTDGGLREKELEIAAIEKDIANLSSRMDEFSSRLNKWEQEKLGIAKERERSLEMTRGLEGEIADLKRAESETEGKINSMMNEYEAVKGQMDVMNEGVTAIRLEAAAAERDKLSGDQMLSRVKTGIAEIKGDMAARGSELEEAVRLETELASGEFDLDGLVAAKEKEKKELELRLAIIQEQRVKASRLADERSTANAELSAKLEAEQNRKYETEIRKAKNDTLLDSMKDKLWDEFELSHIQAVEFKKKEFVMSTAVKESREVKNRLKELGEINVGAIKEYESVSERYELLTSQRADLMSAIESLRKIIADTDKNIIENFRSSFNSVVANFSETFGLLFGGGKGELRLEDEGNPLECGIEISAQPPGKKLQNMNLLSGGEKTMTAIALMFSILKAKPTPFCILDEVEAALDDSNINRFADYLKNFNDTQFALVTHQKATMEYADALYGVTMPEEGISRVLSLRLGDAETAAFAKELA